MEDRELIDNNTEIEIIIKEKIKGKRLIFIDYYYQGILKRGIDHEKVLEIFPQFDKVTKIEKEKQKRGEMGYELYYSLNNNTMFSVATVPKNDKVIIIHAIEHKRKLDYRFRKFKL